MTLNFQGRQVSALSYEFGHDEPYSVFEKPISMTGLVIIFHGGVIPGAVVKLIGSANSSSFDCRRSRLLRNFPVLRCFLSWLLLRCEACEIQNL